MRRTARLAASLLLCGFFAIAVPDGHQCSFGDVDDASCTSSGSTSRASAGDLNREQRRQRRSQTRANRESLLSGDDSIVRAAASAAAATARATHYVNDTVFEEQEEEDLAFEVAGSDIVAMNGVYVRTDEWHGQPLYTNQGLTAVLYFRPTLNGGSWYVVC